MPSPNYIICLAHFCELHGPSTIVCTQVTTPQHKSDFLLPTTSKLQTCASCKLLLPDDSVNLESSNESVSYVTAQYPSCQLRYSSLSKLVMKTLSVETTADSSKPVFFGDNVNGYCINRMFKISDINARGGERKYSLMVVSDDEKELLLHWETVSLFLNELISLIQEQVLIVVEEKRPATNSKSNGTSGNMFDNERYLRRSLVKPKSLIELTNDNKLFVKLHLWAIEVLKHIQ